MYLKPGFNGCWAIKCNAEIGTLNKTIQQEIHNQKVELIQYLKNLITANMQSNSIVETEKLALSIYILYDSAFTESHLHMNDCTIYSARSIANQLISL